MNKLRNAWVGFGALLVTMAATASVAGATATYDITPVTTGFTSDLTSNLGVILPLLGGLIALGVILRFMRKNAKPS